MASKLNCRLHWNNIPHMPKEAKITYIILLFFKFICSVSQSLSLPYCCYFRQIFNSLNNNYKISWFCESTDLFKYFITCVCVYRHILLFVNLISQTSKFFVSLTFSFVTLSRQIRSSLNHSHKSTDSAKQL
jgi:hypothetical protein